MWKSTVIGTGRLSAKVSVRKMWRRKGETGTEAPASPATTAAWGPAQSTTSGVETRPRAVTTAATASRSRSIPVTSMSSSTVAPCRRAAAA